VEHRFRRRFIATGNEIMPPPLFMAIVKLRLWLLTIVVPTMYLFIPVPFVGIEVKY
jgi:hypothetical protein